MKTTNVPQVVRKTRASFIQPAGRFTRLEQVIANEIEELKGMLK